MEGTGSKGAGVINTSSSMGERMLQFFRFRTHSRGTEVDAIKNEFDEEFYRNNFISEHEVVDNLLRHYLETGWRRGYDPCSWFSTSHYLRMHSDVAAAGINPFVHYVINGRKEKREIFPSDIIIKSEKISTVIKSQYDVVIDDFDVEFYRARNPDLATFSDAGLINHYNEFGWKEHRDPCAWFSTAYYLNRYRDISGANINPFCHYILYGQAEGRLPNYYSKTKQIKANPLRVSAIIPNYNHARFLEQRIASITSQSLPVHELIILDDASSDDSREVILSLKDKLNIPVKTVFNDKNSGNVFRQWEKGVSLATGEIIWICESDDFCDENFLSVLAPYFNDPSVMIAFGAIQFCKADGSFLPGLDSYRESAEPGVWAQPRVEAAASWFGKAFGLRNVIANVGGCLIRRQEIEPSIWAGAQSYKVCGDWYLYVHLSRGGRIAFDPEAIAYFRQHQSNTSVSSFKKSFFYEEHFRIAQELRREFDVSDERLCKYYRNVMAQFYNNFTKSDERILHDTFNLASLVADERRRRHVLFVILGFYTGGGEIFSICLANALVERGFTVSVMVLEAGRPNVEIRSRLDARIAVYERPLIDEMGFVEFARESQVDIVHTHFVWADILIHRDIAKVGVPYVVTHHGSYETIDIEPVVLQSILAAVSHWVYIAEKNLTKLDVLGLDRAKVTKLPNALPKRQASFPHSRESLDIDADAFVFGVASRALRVKGWDIAIEAFKRIKAQSARAIYLLICGEGPDHAELSALYEKTEGVHFLGYQRDIMGFYNICDCCVLPTRFPGESYPLTIIEAILMRRPVIATDIGEIKNMIEQNSVSAGIVVPYADEDEVFCASVAQAMRKMLDAENFNKFSANAAQLGKSFDFDSLVSKYIEVYKKAGLMTVAK